MRASGTTGTPDTGGLELVRRVLQTLDLVPQRKWGTLAMLRRVLQTLNMVLQSTWGTPAMFPRM